MNMKIYCRNPFQLRRFLLDKLRTNIRIINKVTRFNALDPGYRKTGKYFYHSQLIFFRGCSKRRIFQRVLLE